MYVAGELLLFVAEWTYLNRTLSHDLGNGLPQLGCGSRLSQTPGEFPFTHPVISSATDLTRPLIDPMYKQLPRARVVWMDDSKTCYQ